MSRPETFFNFADLSEGIARSLAEGIDTRVFPGDQAMLCFFMVTSLASPMLAQGQDDWVARTTSNVLFEGENVRVYPGSRNSGEPFCLENRSSGDRILLLVEMDIDHNVVITTDWMWNDFRPFVESELLPEYCPRASQISAQFFVKNFGITEDGFPYLTSDPPGEQEIHFSVATASMGVAQNFPEDTKARLIEMAKDPQRARRHDGKDLAVFPARLDPLLFSSYNYWNGDGSYLGRLASQREVYLRTQSIQQQRAEEQRRRIEVATGIIEGLMLLNEYNKNKICENWGLYGYFSEPWQCR